MSLRASWCAQKLSALQGKEAAAAAGLCHLFSCCSCCFAMLWSGLPMMVFSLVTSTLPGGAPLGFLMSVGDAMMTGHLPSPLPLECHAARSAANCRSCSGASLQSHHTHCAKQHPMALQPWKESKLLSIPLLSFKQSMQR